ncbi:hypothetical protein SE17_29175, partial [Kouleothrix aurantiaca]
AHVRTTAPGWAHAILSAEGVRELAEGSVRADAQRTVIVAAGAIAANLLPEGVALSAETRAAAAAVVREPDQEHAAALVRALEDESNRAGIVVGQPPAWAAQTHPGWRAVARGVVDSSADMIALANGALPPEGADEVAQLTRCADTIRSGSAAPAELRGAAQDYLNDHIRNRAEFARALAFAAGTPQCPDCGQFVGQSGHVCPARAFDPSAAAAAIQGMHPAVAGALRENISSDVVTTVPGTNSTAAPTVSPITTPAAPRVLQPISGADFAAALAAGRNPSEYVADQRAAAQASALGIDPNTLAGAFGGTLLGPSFQAAFQAAADALGRGDLTGAAAALQGGVQPLSDDQMRTLFLGGGTLHPDGSMTAPDGSLIAPAGTFAQAAAGLTTPTVMPERDPNALLTALGLAPGGNGGSGDGDGGDGDDDADAKGLKCGTCGQFMGREPHVCQPAWLENYPAELSGRAEQFVRGLPGIVELANGSKPLGSGPHSTSERRALETYATHMVEIGGVGEDAIKIAEAYLDQPYRNAQAFAAIVAIAAGTQKCPDCGQFM